MPVKKLSKDEFAEYTAQLNNGYTLFESELLQDGDYDKQAKELEKKHSHDLPKSKTAEELIEAIDPYTFHSRIWEDTLFDEFQHNGPILSYFSEPTPLAEHYLNEWGHWHAGVFIETLNEAALVRHLQSLLLVKLGSEGEVHYRLQEPRKLSGVLNAFDNEQRISELLGPIKAITWQQNCGADTNYYQVSNLTPHETQQQIGWFTFSHDEQKKIDDWDNQWYKRSIVSTLEKEIEQNPKHTQHLANYSTKEIENILDKGFNVAKKNNIQDEENLRFFILNSLLYPEFMNSKEAGRITAQDLWLEPKKISLLKEKLALYKQEHNLQETGEGIVQ